MENEKQPTIELWDRVSTEDFESHPKVNFEINIPVNVVFKTDRPREVLGDNGAYCIFDVKEGEEDKVIMTSAFTLLRDLKKLAPLKDKAVTIVKKMDKGKQFFIATLKQ